MRYLGVSRAELYSPNRVSGDTAVFRAVASELERHGHEGESSIRIPRHAFDHFLLPIHHRRRRALDLLTARQETHVLHPDVPVELALPPLGGKVLKFNL